jgi:hypothetical protein
MVYAWMEDVALIGQTSQLPMTTLSGQTQTPIATEMHMAEGDTKGPISKIASTVQSVAKAAEKLPGVGPYAKATDIAAGAIGNVAKQLGYSKPTNLEPITKMITFPAPPMATTNEMEPAYVLSTDVRQEQCIDPRVAGFQDLDELSIDFLCGKESYLTSGTIDLSTPINDVLFNCVVSPMLFDVDVANNDAIHSTPMAYVARLFQYWRGNLVFRFIFHTNAYHKAKVRLIHDHTVRSAYPTTEREATNFAEHHIMDLTESRMCEVKVGWCRQEKYMRLSPNLITATEIRHATNSMAPAFPTSFNEGNGMLTMVLENELVSPYNADATDATVRFSVFVRGEDMQFAQPTDIGTRDLALSAPPATLQEPLPTEAHMAMGDPTELKDTTSTDEGPCVMGIPTTPGVTDLIFIGETVSSLRSLMKRFTNYATFIQSTDNSVIWAMTHQHFPIPRGQRTGVDDLPSRAMTLLNYVSQAFIARRGGVRYHIKSNNSAYSNHFQVTRSWPQSGVQLDGIIVNTAAEYALNWVKFTGAGITGTQTAEDFVSISLPGSSSRRFQSGRDFIGYNINQDGEPGFSITCMSGPNPGGGTWTANNTAVMLSIAVAAAEDLTFHGFICAPILYRDNIRI